MPIGAMGEAGALVRPGSITDGVMAQADRAAAEAPATRMVVKRFMSDFPGFDQRIRRWSSARWASTIGTVARAALRSCGVSPVSA